MTDCKHSYLLGLGEFTHCVIPGTRHSRHEGPLTVKLLQNTWTFTVTWKSGEEYDVER